jgi:hypothetical protein
MKFEESAPYRFVMWRPDGFFLPHPRDSRRVNTFVAAEIRKLHVSNAHDMFPESHVFGGS